MKFANLLEAVVAYHAYAAAGFTNLEHFKYIHELTDDQLLDLTEAAQELLNADW